MSIYPEALDGYEQIPLIIDGVTEVNSFTVNAIRDAILKIEVELGIAPSGAYGTVSERIFAIDGDGTLQERLVDIEQDILALESGPTITVISDEALIEGDLLRINSSGNVVKAGSNTGTTNDSRVIGSSAGVFAIAESAEIRTRFGSVIPARFASAPAGLYNGSPVYLSGTAGLATLIPPTITGSIIFFLGILQGADGISVVPEIIFQPRLVARN